MTNEQLNSAKAELAAKALPHLVDPDGYGPADLSAAECATLMSRDAAHMVTGARFDALEKGALAKLGSRLRAAGVSSAADCIPPRRA